MTEIEIKIFNFESGHNSNSTHNHPCLTCSCLFFGYCLPVTELISNRYLAHQIAQTIKAGDWAFDTAQLRRIHQWPRRRREREALRRQLNLCTLWMPLLVLFLAWLYACWRTFSRKMALLLFLRSWDLSWEALLQSLPNWRGNVMIWRCFSPFLLALLYYCCFILKNVFFYEEEFSFE